MSEPVIIDSNKKYIIRLLNIFNDLNADNVLAAVGFMIILFKQNKIEDICETKKLSKLCQQPIMLDETTKFSLSDFCNNPIGSEDLNEITNIAQAINDSNYSQLFEEAISNYKKLLERDIFPEAPEREVQISIEPDSLVNLLIHMMRRQGVKSVYYP